MRVFAFALLAVSTVSAAVVRDSVEPVSDSPSGACEPGKTFKHYCNSCMCGADGVMTACTLMLCPEGVYNRDGSLKTPAQVPDSSLARQTRQVSHNRPCEAGKEFKIYCNTCACGSDGFSVSCTRKACPPGHHNEDGSLTSVGLASQNAPSRQTRQVGLRVSCEPGKPVNVYCNKCACGPDGLATACTRMACPEGMYNLDGSLTSPQQVPDNALIRKRRQVSSEHVSDSPTGPCEPGKSFKHYCNSCRCRDDGVAAACTLMMCPEGVYNRDGSLKTPVQVPDSSLARQTRQVSHNRPCEAGKAFKIYCNTCACGSDGFSVSCTRMECPPGHHNEDGSLTSVGLASQNAPRRQTRQVGLRVSCEPGKPVNVYCNKCACGPDGLSTACTRMACPEGMYNLDGSLTSPQQVPDNALIRKTRQVSSEQVSDSPTGPCEPGKSFKHYCNSCRCRDDGVAAACTLMMCPEGVYNRDGSLKTPV